ncbi:MAG: hypothetical protein WAW96_12730, partial [Alphaproteobacteria bacterium]
PYIYSMSVEPKSGRKSGRPYVRVCDRRRRGAQPGNMNALKSGAHCAPARGLNREISLLLKDARTAIQYGRSS